MGRKARRKAEARKYHSVEGFAKILTADQPDRNGVIITEDALRGLAHQTVKVTHEFDVTKVLGEARTVMRDGALCAKIRLDSTKALKLVQTAVQEKYALFAGPMYMVGDMEEVERDGKTVDLVKSAVLKEVAIVRNHTDSNATPLTFNVDEGQ